MAAEKELAVQSKLNITALNKKLNDLESKTTSIIDQEILDITTQRKKARDKRRKKDGHLASLKALHFEARGAVGNFTEKKESGGVGSRQKIDMNSLLPPPPKFWDDFCSMTLEKIYPEKRDRIRFQYNPKEFVKNTKLTLLTYGMKTTEPRSSLDPGTIKTKPILR